MAYLRHSIYDEQVKKEKYLAHYGIKGMKWADMLRKWKDSDYDANGNLKNEVQTQQKQTGDWAVDSHIPESQIYKRNLARQQAQKIQEQKMRANQEAARAQANYRQAIADGKTDETTKDIPESQIYKKNAVNHVRENAPLITQNANDKDVYNLYKADRNHKASVNAYVKKPLNAKVKKPLLEKLENLKNSIKKTGIVGTAKSYGTNLYNRGKDAVNNIIKNTKKNIRRGQKAVKTLLYGEQK